MKITKRQLSRVINEVLKEYQEMPTAEHVELTAEPNQADISSAWPDKVMYEGQKVFDIFYSDAAMNAQATFVQNAGWDDHQEAYLGYDVSSDTFVMGFDAWPEFSDDMEGVAIELSQTGQPVDVIGSFPGGMYPAGLNGIKSAFPSIIDVRLD